jgi:hypothetical protein
MTGNKNADYSAAFLFVDFVFLSFSLREKVGMRER